MRARLLELCRLTLPIEILEWGPAEVLRIGQGEQADQCGGHGGSIGAAASRLAGESVVRQEMVALPRFTYSAAMQAADGVGVGFDLTVAQLSVRFGAGPAKRVSFA